MPEEVSKQNGDASPGATRVKMAFQLSSEKGTDPAPRSTPLDNRVTHWLEQLGVKEEPESKDEGQAT